MRNVILIFSFFLFVIVGNVSAQSNKEYIREFLEEYCKQYYENCFSGRKYVHRTLTVDSIDKINENTALVTGTHAYRGNFGSLYEYMDYKVYITSMNGRTIIKFHKKSKADFFNSTDYWEECVKVIE